MSSSKSVKDSSSEPTLKELAAKQLNQSGGGQIGDLTSVKNDTAQPGKPRDSSTSGPEVGGSEEQKRKREEAKEERKEASGTKGSKL